VQIGEAQRALPICNKILQEKNVRLKMQTHKMSLDEEVANLDLNKELHWS
jgi:hypothetical protein